MRIRNPVTFDICMAFVVLLGLQWGCSHVPALGEPLDVGGWRASSDAVWLHQYPACPPSGCPDARGGSVWVSGGISRYGQSILGQRQAQQARPTVCQMLRDGGFAGSGVYVGEVAGSYLVLTCKHIGAISSVRFGNGDTAVVVDAFSDKYGYDLVAFSIGPSIVSPMVMGETPQEGETVVIAGYPSGRYGERSGPVVGYHQPEADQPWGDMQLGFACPGAGDSGGPVLDRQGRLVGIHWGSDHKTYSVATSTPAIKDFLTRVAATIRGKLSESVLPGPAPLVKVPPISGSLDVDIPLPGELEEIPKEGDGDDELMLMLAELTKNQTGIIENQTGMIENVGKLVTSVDGLISRVDQLEMGYDLLEKKCVVEKGDKGDKGDQGIPGVADVSGVAYIVLSELKHDHAFLVKVAALVPVVPLTPPTSKTHLVLVRDTGGEYWKRMSEELEKAKSYFSGIREVDPPQFATPLPRLIGYDDGVPVLDVQGVRNVSESLVAIARGEFSFPRKER